ncbi:single-stranded DNA-binding protein [Neolewinella persica]|uniref:single-stranded DNA-binding protein n=1 Tax=Neolewinella persica TaxID=70998 RepID=UPI00035DC2D1|nr:single-stranded DNA-binding protein [Neolewinella persica]
MNQITLIGRLALPPTYHCTGEGQDLTRFELRTASTSGPNQIEAHHCTAWGPAALDLHQHLNVGDRLLINGELRYRQRRTRQGGTLRMPVIYVRGYTYLGRGEVVAGGDLGLRDKMG